jgi:hypothetical protein
MEKRIEAEAENLYFAIKMVVLLSYLLNIGRKY